ncbi:MAG: thiamine-phosphate kinase [Nitrospirota bacterium]
MKLSRIGEINLLEYIRNRFKKRTNDVLLGIGDDAAVLKPADRNLLVTTDMMVEGIHFDPSFITPYQLGFKLISVNVSDIYAMGGKPFYLLLNIAVKKDTDKKFIDRLFDGIKAAMDFYNVCLIGGDLSAANRDTVLSAAIIGYTRKYIKRSGAKIGDKIYVTGYLGDSACGLELLKRIRRPVPIEIPNSKFHISKKGIKSGLSWKTLKPLLRRHLMPEARDPEKFVKDATSMIDISDGFSLDLSRLCNESNVGARIYIENIPLSTEFKKAVEYLNISPLNTALSGGEDYELLFTAPDRKKVDAIHIGEIIKSGRFFVDSSGKEKPFSAKGYQHFI